MVETIFPPQAYTVLLTFKPIAGGQAIDVEPTSIGVIAELPEWAAGADAFQAYNGSSFDWWILFGPSDMTPALGLPVPAGAVLAYSMPNDGTYTHYCVKTRSGNATGTINFGIGS